MADATQSKGSATKCPKTGTSYRIKVTFGVDVPGMTPAISDIQETVVDCKHECQVLVPGNGQAKQVQLMPPDVCQPTILVIRPIKFGSVDVKKPTDLVGLKLEYATVMGSNPRDRKPILGTHVFANGMAEWVTDMVAGGAPGPLTSLFFWNNSTELDAQGKVLEDEAGKPVPKAVTVLIFAGYSPLTTNDPAGTL